MNYTFIDNIYAQFKQENHERQSECLLWEWQTYVAITQAIKELQSGGRGAGRVEYTVRNSLLNPHTFSVWTDSSMQDTHECQVPVCHDSLTHKRRSDHC
jgi:hypothetical protein